MEKDSWDHAQIVAQIFAILAVPVLVAGFGMSIQAEMKDKEVGRDFVQIAVSVLSSQSDTDEARELKGWAARLLASASPVPFNERELQALDKDSFRQILKRAKASLALPGCKAPVVQAPEWAADKLHESDSPEVKVRALLAERRQRIGYERELVAGIKACQ